MKTKKKILNFQEIREKFTDELNKWSRKDLLKWINNNNMKELTKPCGECPFRKDSLKGWLGGFTVEDTLNCARSEADFDCHLTRDGDEEDRQDCVGRLLFAAKTCKSFYRKDLNEKKKLLRESNNLDNILGFDFTEHHTIKF